MNRYKWMGAFLLALAGLCFSCYEDKGNYDYNWVQDVTLMNKLHDTIIQQGTLFSVIPAPAKSTSAGLAEVNPDDYTFRWEAAWDTKKRQVLSTDRDLNDTIWLPIGVTYQISYTVTEKATGVSWMNRFNMKVVQNLTDGLLLMTEDDNRQVELEIYASNTKGEKIHETGFMARSGFPYRGGGANLVASISCGSAGGLRKYLWMSTGEAMAWLKLPDFSWDETQMLRMLMVKQEPVSYTLCNIGQFHADIAFGFTEDGNVHPLNKNQLVYTDIAYVNNQKFKASPWLGGYNKIALLFDSDRGRFVVYTAGVYGWQFPSNTCLDVADDVAFEGSTLYYMSLVKDYETVAVLKDKDGKYWKCVIKMAGTPTKPELVVDKFELKPSIAMLETADSKAIDFVYKKIYFTSGHKLYCYRDGSGIDDCREVNLMKDGQKLALDEVVAVIVVPNRISNNITDKVYVTTYSAQNKGKVYVTQPDSAEPLDLIVQEEIQTEGRVKSLCKWSN